jgi:hypothetical protein
MKRIIAIILVLSSLVVYAGVSRVVGINVRKSDGSLFDFSGANPDFDGKDGVTFDAYIKSRPLEKLNACSEGSGYTYNTSSFPQLSACRVNIGNFPTAWSEGDTIVFRIRHDLSKASYFLYKEFVIPSGTSAILYGYTSGYLLDGPWWVSFYYDTYSIWLSKNVSMNIRKYDGSLFDFSGTNPDPDGKDGLTFYAYIKSRPDEKLRHADAVSRFYPYSTSLSCIEVNIGNFPTQWAPGDSIVFVAQHEVGKAANGLTKTFMIPSGTTAVHYGYTSGYVFDGPWWVMSPSALDDDPVPAENALYQNYPNPFNPVTQIKFALKKTADVRLSVYNIAGQKVAELARGTRSAGYHTVDFDGSRLNSGIYYYTLEVDGKAMTKKMLMVK